MNEKSIFRKGTILDIVREHMRDCAGVSERDIDDHGERIAFRLQKAFLLQNDATVKACADAADRELESEVSAATRDAVSDAVNAVADAARGMKPNVKLTGAARHGQQAKPQEIEK